MSNSEKQLGLVKDVILPVDLRMRYDVYFTDKRIAIACLGKAERFESDTSSQVSLMPSAFGVPPPVSVFKDKPKERRTIDEEIRDLPLDDVLKLSKKSCFYTHDEIEEIKLIAGRKPKFIILSKECESKFSPTQEQFKELCEILPTIETLRNKLWITINWNMLNDLIAGLPANNSEPPSV